MLDILTIVHSFADIQTASRIRRTCRRLAILTPEPTFHNVRDHSILYEYRVGTKLHRLDGPARISVSGHKSWHRGDIANREYHPQCTNGTYMTYMVEGLLHREVGPSIIHNNIAMWWLRDNLHRKTGPADISYGIMYWYTLGKQHRLDGPAYGEIYAIRGVKHSISCTTNNAWVIDDVVIRI